MRKLIIIILVLLAAGLAVNYYLKSRDQDLKSTLKYFNMNISSTAFGDNESIPAKYTCDGENISPPLHFSNVPSGTTSLALVVEDPDAPIGTWVHWTIWNINPSISRVSEGSAPAGAVEGKTSSGKAGYGGPCPPSGTHRYVFKLYALDIMLELSQDAGSSELSKAMQGHVIAQAELAGLYQRQ